MKLKRILLILILTIFIISCTKTLPEIETKKEITPEPIPEPELITEEETQTEIQTTTEEKFTIQQDQIFKIYNHIIVLRDLDIQDIVLDIDGTFEIIKKSQTKIINDLEISNIQVFYEDKKASLKIIKYNLKENEYLMHPNDEITVAKNTIVLKDVEENNNIILTINDIEYKIYNNQKILGLDTKLINSFYNSNKEKRSAILKISPAILQNEFKIKLGDSINFDDNKITLLSVSSDKSINLNINNANYKIKQGFPSTIISNMQIINYNTLDNYVIIRVTNTGEYLIKKDETIILSDKDIELIDVNPDGSIIISINNAQRTIGFGKIDNIYSVGIKNINSYYSSKESLKSALIRINIY